MTTKPQSLDNIITAIYLTGVSAGLHRDITDPEEIMHRKEAFIKSNPTYKEAKDYLTDLFIKMVEEAKPEDSPHHDVEKTNGFYSGVLTYEQNLIKALSEKEGDRV